MELETNAGIRQGYNPTLLKSGSLLVRQCRLAGLQRGLQRLQRATVACHIPDNPSSRPIPPPAPLRPITTPTPSLSRPFSPARQYSSSSAAALEPWTDIGKPGQHDDTVPDLSSSLRYPEPVACQSTRKRNKQKLRVESVLGQKKRKRTHFTRVGQTFVYVIIDWK